MPARFPAGRRLLAAAAACALVACASDGDKHAAPARLEPVEAPVATGIVWQADIGGAQGTFLRPCVLENAVYAASSGGDLVRLDAVDGKVLWRVSVDSGIAGGVGSDGLTVAVAGPRGEVSAFDGQGRLLWTASVPSDVTVPPLVGHGLVLVRSSDNRVTAFDAADGKRRWLFQRQQPALTLRSEAEMVFSGDNVLVGFPGGRLDAVALSNGAGRWDATVSEPKGTTEVERLADVLGVPLLDGDDVCVASYQGRVGCFNAASGDLQWAREFAAGAGLAAGAHALFGVDEQSHVSAFARDSGASLWQSSALLNRRLGAPVMAGGLVAVSDFEGYVHFLRPEDGRIVARLDLGAPAISTPQAWNGQALFQTASGRLVMLAAPRAGAGN